LLKVIIIDNELPFKLGRMDELRVAALDPDRVIVYVPVPTVTVFEGLTVVTLYG
jgi:hypothetical protein